MKLDQELNVMFASLVLPQKIRNVCVLTLCVCVYVCDTHIHIYVYIVYTNVCTCMMYTTYTSINDFTYIYYSLI